MPLDDNYRKACFIYDNITPEPERLKYGPPSPENSESNEIGYYRLRDKDSNVLLRIKASEIAGQHAVITDRLRKNKAAAKERLEIRSKQDAVRGARQMLRLGEDLTLIGGFHKGPAKLVQESIYLYHDSYGALGWEPEIVEEILCRELSIDVLTEDNRASVTGRVLKGAVWGIGLGILSGGLGVLGALGGVMSGRTKKVVVVARLNDGRSMLIDTRYETYKKLLIFSYK